MIRKTIVDCIYKNFFTDWVKKELGGEMLASNVVNAIVKAESPLAIEEVLDDGGNLIMSKTGATAICNHLGIDLFIREVQIQLAYLEENEEVEAILASKPVLLAAQKDLKLLLAIAVHFKDIELLHQAVEDPTNGRVMRSSDTFEYLHRCYELIA